MKHILIVANGEQPVSEQHWKRIERASPLVCTDGAANWVLERDIVPDIVIGDMDSLRSEIRAKIEKNTLRHIPSQENTDLEKAIDYALEQGYDAATILGATGKREDQTLANLYLLVKYAGDIHIQLLTNYCTIEPVTDSLTVHAEIGQVISLLPVGQTEGVSTTGLEYPLENEVLEIGSRGVSNCAVENEVTVSLTSGALLLFRNF